VINYSVGTDVKECIESCSKKVLNTGTEHFACQIIVLLSWWPVTRTWKWAYLQNL